MILFFAGCLFVSDEELADFLDPDGDGYGSSDLGGDDCDDSDAAVGGEQTFYRDADEDGFGDPDTTLQACAPEEGWVSDGSDCDDSDAASTALGTQYEDADHDGYGSEVTRESCTLEEGWTTTVGDCDDTDPLINPGALEGGFHGDADCDGVRGDGELQNVGIFFIGEYEDGLIGTTGAALGDVFGGDGNGDVVLGAPNAGADHGGMVFIARGTDTFGDPGDIQAIRLEDEVNLGEGAAGDEFGAALAVGDLNGDGDLDFVVGAPGAEGSGAFVVYNAPYGTSDFVPDATLVGLATGDRLGSALAIGDLSGDGDDDVLVASTTDAVIYGVPGPLDDEVYSPVEVASDRRFRFEVERGVHPVSLATGDIDGDGLDELFIGAPWSDDERQDAGAVWICPPEGSLRAIEETCVGWFGAVASDDLGTSIAVADLDGSGLVDLVAGAPGVDDERGAVYIFHDDEGGTADNAPIVLHGEDPGTFPGGAAGATVAVVGDIDGNEQPDIAIGAPRWTDPVDGPEVGATYVVLGLLADGEQELAAATDRFVCYFGYGHSGTFVGAAGDIDNDGYDDVLTGATGWQDNEGLVTGAMAAVFARHIH